MCSHTQPVDPAGAGLTQTLGAGRSRGAAPRFPLGQQDFMESWIPRGSGLVKDCSVPPLPWAETLSTAPGCSKPRPGCARALGGCWGVKEPLHTKNAEIALPACLEALSGVKLSLMDVETPPCPCSRPGGCSEPRRSCLGSARAPHRELCCQDNPQKLLADVGDQEGGLVIPKCAPNHPCIHPRGLKGPRGMCRSLRQPGEEPGLALEQNCCFLSKLILKCLLQGPGAPRKEDANNLTLFPWKQLRSCVNKK